MKGNRRVFILPTGSKLWRLTKWPSDSDWSRNEPRHDKTRVFAVRMKKPWVLNYPLSAQRRRWSDWADTQADLSLRWAHTRFVGFVMSWLKSSLSLRENADGVVIFLDGQGSVKGKGGRQKWRYRHCLAHVIFYQNFNATRYNKTILK